MRLPEGIRRLFHLGAVRPDAARDVDDEMAFHFEALVEDLVAQGWDRDTAEARARNRFGDVEAYRRALVHIDAGRGETMKRMETLDAAGRTLCQALRGLTRSPGFTLSVVTILALGLGANAVMFSVVDRLLLSPPAHVRDAGKVRALYLQHRYQNGHLDVGRTMAYPDYLDFKEVAAFKQVAATSGTGGEVLGRGEGAHQVVVASATASLFPLLGVQATMGRFFTESEAAPGGEGTAVISHEMWERDLAQDPAILGTTLDLSSGTYTVIGVAPPGFTGDELERVDVWVPLELHQARSNGGNLEWQDNRNWWWVHAVGRLADDATPDAATAQATAAHRRGRAESIAAGEYDENAIVTAASIIAAQGPNPSSESRVARWLAAVSVIVLLIACFNVANLLLARTAQRRREIAVRVALGVSRARLLTELLTQSLLLALLGCGGALLLAKLAGGAVRQVLLPDVAFTDGPLSGRLLAFMLVAAVITAALSGIVPAAQATRTDLAGSLKGDGPRGGRPPSRTRAGLLIAQAALSAVLLVGAGLFVKSLGHARDLDLGFDARGVLVARVQWNDQLPASERAAIYGDALERVRRLPGVRAAGFTYTVPFQSTISIGTPKVPGRDSVPRHPNGGPYANKVSSGYFEAMGLEMIQGRAFEPADDADNAPPVAVVTEGMARALWPAGDAVGSCMMLDDDTEQPPCTLVVGIVENHRREEIVENDPHWLYFLNESHPAFKGPPQGIMVGTTGEAARLAATVQAEVRGTSTQIRFASARSLQNNVDPQLRSWTLGASMFTAFGILALIVAAWGLYSVLAFEVATRRRELGIRAALGAGGPRLVRMVLLHALALVGSGVAVGVATSLLAARAVGPLLFTVSPWDPTVYAVVAGTLMAVAAGAGLLPAWRATRVDPKEALQSE